MEYDSRQDSIWFGADVWAYSGPNCLPAAQLPAPQEVARDCGMVLLGGENADSYAEYIAELEQNHVLAMYRLKTPDKDWSEEGTKAALLAQQSGFSGVVIPGYTLYKELVQDTDDAESIHLKLWAQYHTQYTAAIRSIKAECGNDFAMIGEVECRDGEPATLTRSRYQLLAGAGRCGCSHCPIRRCADWASCQPYSCAGWAAGRAAVPAIGDHGLGAETRSACRDCYLWVCTAATDQLTHARACSSRCRLWAFSLISGCM